MDVFGGRCRGNYKGSIQAGAEKAAVTVRDTTEEKLSVMHWDNRKDIPGVKLHP